MPNDDNQSSEKASVPSGPSSAPGLDVPEQMPPAPASAIGPQEHAANGGNARGPAGSKADGQEKSLTNFTKGFLAYQAVPRSDKQPSLQKSLWGERYEPVYRATWEHYQPVGYIEELLVDKIAADTIRLHRLYEVESKTLYVPLAHYIGTISRQLFEDYRELERIQEQRKARTAERGASRRQAEDEFSEPDWTVVVERP